MNKINRRKFFSNILALSVVTCVKPSDVTHVTGSTGFAAMSGTSMEVPQMSGRLVLMTRLGRHDLAREIINDLQRQIAIDEIRI